MDIFIRIAMPVALVCFLAACSNDGGGPDQVTTGDIADSAGIELVTADTACTPDCTGKACGPDGCGGECGSCIPQVETCTESGKCVSFTCTSSKDCPGALVCAVDIGQCVECVGNEDCEEGLVCGANHVCHEEIACKSDKDCKGAGLVCDKAAGICVECVKPEHCGKGLFCVDGFCVAAVCEAGASKCDGTDVLSCADGSGWAVSQTCMLQQFCEDGTCLDLVCEPGAVWCEGEVYKVCSTDGKTVQYEEDCGTKALHCFGGACIDSLCVPLQKFCLDNVTAATCLGDGMEYSTLPCEAGQFCEAGLCQIWICEPGGAACQGTVAVVCNSLGSAYASEVDCKPQGKVCMDGKCSDLKCSPSTDFCVDGNTRGHCAEDGLSSTSEDCLADHSCKDGQCLPWQCPPGAAICAGSVATTCDALGLGAVTGGLDCSKDGKYCANGQCVSCAPDCEGKECGDNGCGGVCGTCPDGGMCINGKCPAPGENCNDGNAVDWDGCTQGKISEFHVNTITPGNQNRPNVTVFPDGGFLVQWVSDDKDSGGPGLYSQRFDASGNAVGPETLVVKTTITNQGKGHDTVVLPNGTYAITWSIFKYQESQEIYAKIYNNDGTVYQEDFPVSNETTKYYEDAPTVSAFPDSSFVVAWRQGTYNSSSVIFQRFKPTGMKVGGESNSGLQGKVPTLEPMANGGFLGAAASNGDVWGRRFKDDLTGDGPSFQVNTWTASDQEYPASAIFGPSGFVITWQSSSQDNDGYGVFAQRYGEFGNKVGGEFQVNTWIAGEQSRPAIAAWPDGTFVIGWQSANEDGSGLGIFLQRFDSQGLSVGKWFQANGCTQSDQYELALAGFPDKSYITVWTSKGDPADPSAGIYAQRFTGTDKKKYR